MATVLTVKEKGLETIVVSDSPYNTSAKNIKAYVVVEPLDADSDGSNVIQVGSLGNGEAADVDIEIPCFFETANVVAGATYSMEIVADPDGPNPIVLASDKDLYIRIEEVVSL
jgi:hypothetical protein